MHYRKTFSCLVASTRIISQQCLNLELFPLPAARNVCTRAYIRVRKIKRAAHGALFRRTFVSGEVTYRCDPGSILQLCASLLLPDRSHPFILTSARVSSYFRFPRNHLFYTLPRVFSVALSCLFMGSILHEEMERSLFRGAFLILLHMSFHGWWGFKGCLSLIKLFFWVYSITLVTQNLVGRAFKVRLL